jgi:hypothetical protein
MGGLDRALIARPNLFSSIAFFFVGRRRPLARLILLGVVCCRCGARRPRCLLPAREPGAEARYLINERDERSQTGLAACFVLFPGRQKQISDLALSMQVPEKIR